MIANIRRSHLRFLAAALALGLAIATALPAAPLIGLRALPGSIGAPVSAVLGGSGIGLLIAGIGLFLAVALRSVARVVRPGGDAAGGDLIASLWYCLGGATLMAWYIWSYLYPI